MEHEFYECPEYLSNTPAEVERTEEYEYEVQFWDSEVFYFMIVRPRVFLCAEFLSPLSASFSNKIQNPVISDSLSCSVSSYI